MDITTSIWVPNRLQNRVAIIGADPGGINALIGLLLLRDIRSAKAYIPSCSRQLFREYTSLDISFTEDWEALIKDSDLVILGASWSDRTFLRAIEHANAKHKPSWLVLDSWYDYAARFEFSVKHPSKLPTKFIVSDAIAENILKERLDLDRDRVIVEDNLQFRYFLHKTKRLRKEPAEPAALILGSPLSKAKAQGMVEPSALSFTETDFATICIETLSELKINSIIRPHPSQSPEAYADFACEPYCEISDNPELAFDLGRSSLIIGYCSAALAIATLMGKQSICFGLSRSKDFFKWETYGVYDYYQIQWAGSQSDLHEHLLRLYPSGIRS